MDLRTRLLHHDGDREDDGAVPVSEVLARTVTYRYPDVAALAGRDDDETFYARYGHPNFASVERTLAAIGEADDAALFASGMAAVSALLHAFVPHGGRLVAAHDLYGGTVTLLDEAPARLGITVERVDARDPAAVAGALPGADLFLAETPTNPLLRVLDLAALAAVCRAEAVRFAVDTTFAGPVNLAPRSFGVDLVVESATKSLGGHSDLMGGVVSGAAADVARVRAVRRTYGAVPDPETAWLLGRSLKTLAVRMTQQCASALDLAARLEAHPAVARVRYPGLASHPDHGVAERQRRSGGGHGQIVTFHAADGAPAARAFADRVRLIANAPSLGSVESLVSLPAFTTHAGLAPAVRDALGITDDLVRLSIGIEHVDDLWTDIEHALA